MVGLGLIGGVRGADGEATKWLGGCDGGVRRQIEGEGDSVIGLVVTEGQAV